MKSERENRVWNLKLRRNDKAEQLKVIPIKYFHLFPNLF